MKAPRDLNTSPTPSTETSETSKAISKPLRHDEQHESRLLDHLLSDYNKQVRPIIDHRRNITVHVGITLTQIFDMVSLSRFYWVHDRKADFDNLWTCWNRMGGDLK